MYTNQIDTYLNCLLRKNRLNDQISGENAFIITVISCLFYLILFYYFIVDVFLIARVPSQKNTFLKDSEKFPNQNKKCNPRIEGNAMKNEDNSVELATHDIYKK